MSQINFSNMKQLKFLDLSQNNLSRLDFESFEFLLKWHYKVPKPKPPGPSWSLNAVSQQQNYEFRLKEIEKESQRKLDEIQKRFDLLQEQILAQGSQTSKGKGRGKGASGGSNRSSTRTIRQSLQNVTVSENPSTGKIKVFLVFSNLECI